MGFKDHDQITHCFSKVILWGVGVISTVLEVTILELLVLPIFGLFTTPLDACFGRLSADDLARGEYFLSIADFGFSYEAVFLLYPDLKKISGGLLASLRKKAVV